MIPITRPELPPLEEYEALLAEIWESRMLSNFAKFAKQLEQLTAEYLGVGTRVVVNGDIGLVLAVAALDLPAGSAALVPSFTFNSTVNALLWNRLRPVFVDIEADSFNIDPEAARRAGRHHDARLILATHVFGNPCDVDSLQSVGSEVGAHVIFDSAHAYGSLRNGLAVGRFGKAEIFSLSGTKPVTSAEGGLIASRDDELLKRIDYLRAYGFQNDYNSRYVGLNGKMSELHAALGLLTLRRVDKAIAARQELVQRYQRRLNGVHGLTFQSVRPVDTSTYKDFALVFPSSQVRDRVERDLAACEVQTKRYFIPCHGMPAFRKYATDDLPVTDDLSDRVLCIPLYESLPNGDLEFVASRIHETA